MTEELRRVEVGFDGGQVIAVRISDEELESLRKGLGGNAWHRLNTDEAELDLNVAKVLFVKTAGEDHKVGF